MENKKELAREMLNQYFKIGIDLEIPYHDLGSMFNPNGFIDFITWEDVKYPIVHGVDITGRYFIVIKLIIEGEKIMETIFQRWSDSEYFLSRGTATNSLLLNTLNGMNEKQIELIRDLIEGGRGLIREDHRPNNYSWIGKQVFIYDKKDILVR